MLVNIDGSNRIINQINILVELKEKLSHFQKKKNIYIILK